MFVQDFVHLDHWPEWLQAEAASGWCPWLRVLVDEVLAGEAAADMSRPSSVANAVRVSLGEPKLRGVAVVVPVCWVVLPEPGQSLTVDASLEITPLGPQRTRIALSGHYELPAGVSTRSADGLALHGLAEDSARTILRRLVVALAEHRRALA